MGVITYKSFKINQAQLDKNYISIILIASNLAYKTMQIQGFVTLTGHHYALAHACTALPSFPPFRIQ